MEWQQASVKCQTYIFTPVTILIGDVYLIEFPSAVQPKRTVNINDLKLTMTRVYHRKSGLELATSGAFPFIFIS